MLLEIESQAQLNLPIGAKTNAAAHRALERSPTADARGGGAVGLPWLQLIAGGTQRRRQESSGVCEVGTVKQIVELSFELYVLLLANSYLLAQGEIELGQAGSVQCIPNIVAKGSGLRCRESCWIQEGQPPRL